VQTSSGNVPTKRELRAVRESAVLKHPRCDIRLNRELFPESANPYDSLGEACMNAPDSRITRHWPRRSRERSIPIDKHHGLWYDKV
jgi:hypothetical protein